jgi:hypothetical protein
MSYPNSDKCHFTDSPFASIIGVKLSKKKKDPQRAGPDRTLKITRGSAGGRGRETKPKPETETEARQPAAA